ncbi:TIGR04282 family arsenosugar biosynthesis glycosyltransferase [Portibacter lacus]|uniref:Glycosyltransferase n=1 Tax=Portibacter lacus TaxID=1099794 RepID=A0AA37SN97_9BACT|nr:TIGR04282 family arsenosugar biosynthesis glycosyltransferase [Portibacter lacus]GLR16847.1 hypothetical protein GCM10007940_14620 [Portibacter lacus]
MIFTKNPILGTAKTRIGKVKGDETALKVYLRLLTYTRDITKSLSAKKIVFFNKSIEKEGIWDDHIYSKSMQVDGNLGDKMGSAFTDELKVSDRVIIIGSDCATLTQADIEDAFKTLDTHDTVIGPAEDGGYYLLGMKSNHNFIFEDMPWSQENLLEETLAKLSSKGLSYALLPVKSDIDYWEDWAALGWEL